MEEIQGNLLYLHRVVVIPKIVLQKRSFGNDILYELTHCG